jgi:hypothetical protein
MNPGVLGSLSGQSADHSYAAAGFAQHESR